MMAAILLGATGGLVIYCWRYDRQLKRERLAREAHWASHPCTGGARRPGQPCHVRLVPSPVEVGGVEGDG